jgi:hypothetical protein
MKDTKELSESLSKSLTLDKRRIVCLAGMVMALMVVRTISLPKVVTAIMGGGKSGSWYRRAQRFFSEAKLDLNEVAQFSCSLFFTKASQISLTMDRTNWKFGKKNINLLVLGAVYRGSAIPLMWTQLEKRGNSNTKERIELINRFIKVFGKSRIRELYGDREFVGKDWFSYLLQEKIPFSIRIKDNSTTHNSKGQSVPVRQLFRNLRRGEHRCIPSKRTIWEQSIFLSAVRLEDGTFLVIASTGAPETAAERYKARWEIEIFFECLKGRGFHFEDTRITQKERLERLLAVLSIAYVWGYKVGEWSEKHIAPIRMKNHGRPEKRIFRYGIDNLKQSILGTDFIQNWHHFLKLLSPQDALPHTKT